MWNGFPDHEPRKSITIDTYQPEWQNIQMANDEPAVLHYAIVMIVFWT